MRDVAQPASRSIEAWLRLTQPSNMWLMSVTAFTFQVSTPVRVVSLASLANIEAMELANWVSM